jgi:EAL domain-containing protein (putative c-di-GMP-specific phosphodiesterase class I)
MFEIDVNRIKLDVSANQRNTEMSSRTVELSLTAHPTIAERQDNWKRLSLVTDITVRLALDDLESRLMLSSWLVQYPAVPSRLDQQLSIQTVDCLLYMVH